MLRSAVAIAGVIGLAAFSHRLLPDYLTSSESQTPKPQSQDKNQNKAGCTEQEAINSDDTDVPLCCIVNDLYTPFKLLQETCCNEMKCILASVLCYERRPGIRLHSGTYNSNAFDALERSILVLGNIMEALADPNTHLVGVYGLDDEIKDTLLQRVYRRINRDNLFGMVVTATVTKYPDVRKIQEEVAHQLGFTFNHKSKDKRAKELNDRVKNEQNILIVLRDLCRELDLSKVGIPYGACHMGCKILLTSKTEHVLSDHMHTQKNFMV